MKVKKILFCFHGRTEIYKFREKIIAPKEKRFHKEPLFFW